MLTFLAFDYSFDYPQYALRMIALGQIDKVLGMERLPACMVPANQRKRLRTDMAGGGGVTATVAGDVTAAGGLHP